MIFRCFQTRRSAPIDEFPIFGHTEQRVIDLMHRFVSHLEALPEEFDGKDFDRWSKMGNRSELDEAIARNEEGLGTYDPATGWTIHPLPEHLVMPFS
jgi:hypothetical protein